VAAVLDALDGRIARLLDTSSKFGAELGLSPAARSRIHVEKPEEGKNAASADAKRIFG